VVKAEPRFPFVVVDVAEADADATSAILFELGAQGVEERDATTLVKGAPGKVTLVASFATHDEARAAIAEIAPALLPRLEEIVGDAWRDAWKEHFRPFEVASGVVIKPPWEKYEGSAKVVLELEPGRAFGTGLHETTSLVASVLARHGVAGKEVLDVGTGSGILALLALKLGAARARATDVDPEAILVARENAERNGLALEVDTAALSAIAGTFPIVVANIEARVLVPMAKDLTKKVAPGGILVLSGILVPQKDEVRAAYPSLELARADEKGEWVCLVLAKKAKKK
jgi:ribosomal protein L11 methyltransferase